MPVAKQELIEKAITAKKNNTVVAGDHEKVHEGGSDDAAKIYRSVDIVAEEDLVQQVLPGKDSSKGTLCRFNDQVKPDNDDELTISEANNEQIKRSAETKVVSDFKKKQAKSRDKILELTFNLAVEILSTFDLITDGYLIYVFAMSKHTAWLCLNI